MSKADIAMNLFYTSLFICLYDNQLHGKNDCEATIRFVNLNFIHGDGIIVSNTSGLAILRLS